MAFKLFGAQGYVSGLDVAFELRDSNGKAWSLETDGSNTVLLHKYGTTKVGAVGTTGRRTNLMTVVDDDSQSFTLAAADIKAGINVHTSTSGAGTVTVDTAANIIADIPLTFDGETIVSYYMNDGTQTATFAVATGTTIMDEENTVPTQTAATLVWRRVTSTTVQLYIVRA